MRTEFLLPPLVSHAVHFRRRHGRQIVPVWVVVSHLVLGIRFIQFLAVAVDDAVPQVNAVAGNAYDALHGEETGSFGRDIYQNITLLWWSVFVVGVDENPVALHDRRLH